MIFVSHKVYKLNVIQVFVNNFFYPCKYSFSGLHFYMTFYSCKHSFSGLHFYMTFFSCKHSFSGLHFYMSFYPFKYSFSGLHFYMTFYCVTLHPQLISQYIMGGTYPPSLWNSNETFLSSFQTFLKMFKLYYPVERQI